MFLALLVAAPAVAAPMSPGERGVLAEMNRVRAAHGLAALRHDAALHRAARSHSRSMVARNLFSHGNFAARMRSFGVRGPRLGENLGWGTGGAASPRAIVQAWLASPAHRANLLRPGFRRVGVGAIIGTFAGASGARVVTADFAGR